MQKYPTIDQINAEPKAKPETEPQWGQTSETVTSMPHRWPSTEATAATLAALVVITSFCSRCGCSCCCCYCCCVPCRSQGQQKKKKAARGFLAARAICGLSTRSANNENAFQLLLLPRCASLTGAANGPSRLVICIQHQLNRFFPEPIIDAATSLKDAYAVKTVIYA